MFKICSLQSAIFAGAEARGGRIRSSGENCLATEWGYGFDGGNCKAVGASTKGIANAIRVMEGKLKSELSKQRPQILARIPL